MYNIIVKIHRVLNELKDFTAGSSSNVNNGLVVVYDNKLYKIKVEEINVPDGSTVIDHANKVLNDWSRGYEP